MYRYVTRDLPYSELPTVRLRYTLVSLRPTNASTVSALARPPLACLVSRLAPRIHLVLADLVRRGAPARYTPTGSILP